MVLIGITGSIGHGKSTLSDFLSAQDPAVEVFEFSTLVGEVATALNHFLTVPLDSDNIKIVNHWLSHLPAILESHAHTTVPKELFMLTAEQIADKPADFEKLFSYIKTINLQPQLLNEPITQANKANYRPILQWLGGFCAQYIQKDIWTDELIHRAHNTPHCPLAIISGIRFQKQVDTIHASGGKIIRVLRSTSIADPDDPTERESSTLVADSTLHNDADLSAFETKAQCLYQDLLANKLASTY